MLNVLCDHRYLYRAVLCCRCDHCYSYRVVCVVRVIIGLMIGRLVHTWMCYSCDDRQTCRELCVLW